MYFKPWMKGIRIFLHQTSSLSDIMSTYWTNLAKNGNPNGKGVPEWPAFNGANPKAMYLKADSHTGPVPDDKSLKVLDSYYQWRFTQEGKDWLSIE